MGFRGFNKFGAFYALSILSISACGELPGFQVGQKSDYGVQSVEPIDFTDLDILFVVDNSGSMQQEQDNLADSFESFITQFAERDLNFHIGVISTDMTATSVSGWWQGTRALDSGCTPAYRNIYNGGPGTLLSKYSAYKFLTPEVPDYITKFKNNVKLGTCGTGAETGILSAHSFLDTAKISAGGYNEDFVRPDGFLAVIFLSDEDEGVSAEDTTYIKTKPAQRVTRVNDFKARMTALKPGRPELLRVDAIVGRSYAECPTLHSSTSVGDVYMEVAAAMNGKSSNICQDFSAQLMGIGTQILTFLTRFPLLQPPVNADVEVKVNGSVVPKDEVNGWVLVEENGKYFVEFRGTAVPNNGDQIQITYVPSRPVG